jgi:tetratricopeptide (TPR) repeat protein
MLARLWKFVCNVKNREILSWLGGGAVVIVAGTWALFTYFFPHDDKKPTVINTTIINNVGLNEKQFSALVQQVNANRSGPATPNQEQAVAEALAAAQKGAAQGDATLQQALDLLKANKIAEAETKFRAVADEKAARISQDKKDAAAAYRNLGAIAGLRDPKKALDAYEKALEFDPDDVESLLQVAGIQIDRGDA